MSNTIRRSCGRWVILGLCCACTVTVRAEESVTPAIPGVVAAGTRIELIKDGFEGTEGPIGLPDGSLIFTETRANRITRLAPDNSVSTYLESSNGSNGLAFDKEGALVSVLGEHVLAYDVASDGSIDHRRDFAKLDGFAKNDRGVLSSGADGLAVDEKGRLYVATTLGVQVFDAAGTALGTISLPKPPQNLAFAGKSKRSLYVVGRGAAYRIAVLTPGFGGRAK